MRLLSIQSTDAGWHRTGHWVDLPFPATLKMSGSLCSLLDTVYWSPICWRLIGLLPPRRSGAHLHRAIERFDFQRAWRETKLIGATFAAAPWWKWKNAKENWPLQGCKWAEICLSCNFPVVGTGVVPVKDEFNYFCAWKTSVVISLD